MTNRPQGATGHYGFSLIEVLVALVVLSIGLMALMALHVQTLQRSTASLQGVVAQLQAHDVAERLWLQPCNNASQVEQLLTRWHAQVQQPTRLPDWQATWSSVQVANTPHLGHSVIALEQRWGSHGRASSHWLTVPLWPCP